MTKNTYIAAGIVLVIVIVAVLYLQTRPQEATVPQEETRQANVPADENAPFGLSIPLSPQGNSEQRGGADFFESEGKVEVMVLLENTPPDSSQPAHLHLGSCSALGEIVFPLNPIVDGSSQTTLNVSSEEFQNRLPLAINVHKSEDELGVSVACGLVLAQ